MGGVSGIDTKPHLNFSSELSPLPREVAGAVFVLSLGIAVELILRRDKLVGGILMPLLT